MATSKIKTGLRLITIPNSSFTWDSTNKRFLCSKSDFLAAVGDMNVQGLICYPFGATYLINAEYRPTSSTYCVNVCGWKPSNGTSITEDDANYFVVKAIGY